MVDILHRVGVEATPERVFEALTTIDGLAGWWTTDTHGDGDVGGVLQFRFGEKGGFDMNVRELDHGKHVLWEVVDGPEEWIGTHVDWRAPSGRTTGPRCCSGTWAGGSRWSSCTTAAPSGRRT